VDVITKARITAAIKVGDAAIFHIIEAPSNVDAAKRTNEMYK
jgi:hypothetical protein